MFDVSLLLKLTTVPDHDNSSARAMQKLPTEIGNPPTRKYFLNSVRVPVHTFSPCVKPESRDCVLVLQEIVAIYNT